MKQATIQCFGKVGSDWWMNTGERDARNQSITRQQGMAILAAAQAANVAMRPHSHGIYTTYHFDAAPFVFGAVEQTSVISLPVTREMVLAGRC